MLMMTVMVMMTLVPQRSIRQHGLLSKVVSHVDMGQLLDHHRGDGWFSTIWTIS